jgi:hypothetical protein
VSTVIKGAARACQRIHPAPIGRPGARRLQGRHSSKEARIDTVLNGRPQTVMQPFKHLSNLELAAVIT